MALHHDTLYYNWHTGEPTNHLDSVLYKDFSYKGYVVIGDPPEHRLPKQFNNVLFKMFENSGRRKNDIWLDTIKLYNQVWKEFDKEMNKLISNLFIA